MRQQTPDGSGFDKRRERTRREQFLAEMDRIVSWGKLVAEVEPCYYSGERGRQPVGLERMLRLCCLRNWYNLSDSALEEELDDIEAMRCFVGIDLGREPAPDETTICKFRNLLEPHDLGVEIFADPNRRVGCLNRIVVGNQGGEGLIEV